VDRVDVERRQIDFGLIKRMDGGRRWEDTETERKTERRGEGRRRMEIRK
jgi:hypothetical protein